MYRAKDTFWAPDNRRIVKGDLVAPHDPVLDGREELFEEVVIPKALPKPKPKPTKPEPEPEPEPENDGLFDPAEHSVPDVLDYLEAATYEEASRVLQAESDGKARTTVLHPGGPLLARKEQEQKDKEAAQ
ncbi:hypothetical protein ACFV5J_25130 [Streptomyces zaomyceticus]|uniref:hypothetical protein n=1 Tax=Streptomyces zaomyceticus TaxID=68286 RepID=UPI003668D43D